MTTCTFIFRCRRCLAEHEGPVGGEDPARYGLMSAVLNLPYPDTFIGIPPKMHDIHHCEDSDFVGVSDLIGYKKEELEG